MKVFTTEIASDTLVSDNPVHQRLLMPYFHCSGMVKGDLLELGCGEGRGISIIRSGLKSYLGIDKIGHVIVSLKTRFPDCGFIQSNFPPLKGIENDKFDRVIAFQVIEHIRDDRKFLSEIHRVLKPGGMAMITTPNRKMSITRNPWHIREYLPHELKLLAEGIFDKVELKGITGNEKVMEYYEKNKRSAGRITRFDIFDLQHRLPSVFLKIPYDILNRINRNRLKGQENLLVSTISHNDYFVSEDPDHSLDLLCYLYK